MGFLTPTPNTEHQTNTLKGTKKPFFEVGQYQPIAKPRKRLVARFTGFLADRIRPRSTAIQSSFYDFCKPLIFLCFSINTHHRRNHTSGGTPKAVRR